MSETTESPEAVINKIRHAVAQRKNTLEAIPQPVTVPQKAPILKKAAEAIDRAMAKNLLARKWPRLFRPLRRNQEGINEALITAVEALVKHVDFLSRETAPLAAQQSHIQTRVQHEADYRRVLGERIQALEVTKEAPTLPAEEVDAFYAAFEDQFRGSMDRIRERLQAYLPFLESLKQRCPNIPAVDLGCGRGEWLQTLRENGVAACGVDLNERMVEKCQRAGLNAKKGDALEYLRGIPEGTLALVSGFHIVEQMEFTKLLALFAEVYRVLMPGGIAIFETPNPECLHVSSYTFYIDPTRRNPIPIELLSFMATYTGFSAVQVKRLHPHCENGTMQACEDYAGIFTK